MSAKTDKKPPGAKDETSTADRAGNGNGAGAKAPGGKPKAAAKATKRLRPGELDGLVLSYMCKNEKDLPVTPGTVAKAIGRSTGAIGNCLERLAKAKKAQIPAQPATMVNVATLGAEALPAASRATRLAL